MVFSEKPKQTLGTVSGKHPLFELGEKGPSIAPRLQELRTGEDVETREVNKHEVYALIGHTMEGALREVGTLMEDPALKAKYLNELIADFKLGLLYDQEQGLALDAAQVGTDPVEVMYSLWHVRSLLPRSTEDVLRGERGSIQQNEAASLNRLHEIAHAHKGDWNREHLFREQNGYDILRRGMGTASKETWGLFLTLPLIFRKSLGREMTEDDFEKILPQVGQVLLKMASLHLEATTSAETVTSSFMAGSHRFSKVQLTGFDYLNNLVNRYVIHEQGQNDLHIDFDQEWLDATHSIAKIRQVKIDAEARHGCPVRDIRLRNQEEKLVSGIQAVADFYTPFAKQVIVPNQELFVASFEKVQKGEHSSDLDD